MAEIVECPQCGCVIETENGCVRCPDCGLKICNNE